MSDKNNFHSSISKFTREAKVVNLIQCKSWHLQKTDSESVTMISLRALLRDTRVSQLQKLEWISYRNLICTSYEKVS